VIASPLEGHHAGVDRSAGHFLGVALRRATLVGLVLASVVPACAGRSIRSEDDDGQSPAAGDDDGSVGIGGSARGGDGMGARGAVGGTLPTGGTSTGGFSTGGAPTAIGGTAGTFQTGGTCGFSDADKPGIPQGGSTGTGGVAGANGDPECRGIKSNMACPLEGKLCSNLSCGLADSGRRNCACATNWTCSACDYSSSPFRDRPACLTQCPADAADEVPCTLQNFVCGPIGAEYCACYSSPSDGLIWDCDSPPSSWD
jgi:hypothetical protein